MNGRMVSRVYSASHKGDAYTDYQSLHCVARQNGLWVDHEANDTATYTVPYSLVVRMFVRPDTEGWFHWKWPWPYHETCPQRTQFNIDFSTGS